MGLLLTEKMKEILKDCLKREMKGEEPCSDQIIHISPELLINGLVEMKPHRFKNHERKIAYFITDKGKELLKEL